MPPFRYHRPETTEEALSLLSEFGSDGKVLAGGQSLLPLLALRLARPEHLVDIGGIFELATIDEDGDSLLVGAAVRHRAAEDSAVVARRAPLVSAAMPHIGHRAIRNQGTVCGSLAHADPAAELPAVALASDAELVVRSTAGDRTVPAAHFFLGYLTSDVAETELLTALRLPAWPAATGWSVQEVSRRHGDYALVGLAALVGTAPDGRIERAALAFFGAGSTPVRAAGAEGLLVGQEPGTALFEEAAETVKRELDPPGDNHATRPYRAHVAGVLTRRCLAEAAGRIDAGGGSR